ncbi:tyrosine--tRNA ligase, chloroplastic/mitochondrial-like [Macadamia integrifolia]|uniref:tyrosine--tRNA ligase, chloroplastic/mitochondrial-like n=1 Tax=Macadamia integrifolia TaxID=60698 RepID=UPI001C529425|nr:tyrosine--tRNA ligase, chloroplastic/mitochondrial-like [Macadamia integrifolia]
MACVATTTAASRVFFCSNRKPFFFLSINPSFRFIGCSNKHIVSCLKTPKNDSSLSIRCIQSAQDTLETMRNEGISSVCGRNVVDILEERGLLESITSENLRSACSKPKVSPLKIYCGFDPTAESLHLGNLLGIIVLSWFQRCGHKAVTLIGGATGRIGDPSGKSLERPELDIETLENNTVGIMNTITGILGRKTSISTIGNEKIQTTDMGLCDSFVILNNFDWWKDISLLDFLRNVGRFARVGTMMGKESVKKRLESEEGMSYTEFTYQLLQGYDFLYLFKNEGVNVQIGGSDQWGNITAGTELIRKILQVEGAYGLTFPLLLKSDGTKFGKSEDGAIWLSPSMLSPYKFYQYFFSVPDVDVVRFLKILTFLSMEEIRELEEQMKKSGYVPNSAQRRLAEEVTRFVHGEEGLLEALKATEALRPGAETKMDWKTIEEIVGDVPSCSLAYDQVLNASLVDLSVSTGLFESKSAARRLLKQGGLYLNNNRVDDEGKKIEAVDIVDGKVLLLSAGKKNKMIIRIP